ncbi:hypothetical protein AAEO56_00025 [Flavobacterium sp. DGU11]|uniref:Carboxypeptidase regulatory-like domain-containing protein n=1 Tax=Flavobacterium arundinis TaxID=3139143 RepID=A0ABU9HR54_9FLAO
MKKLLLVITIAGLLAGCGIDYDGTTKLIFKGRVTTPEGTPLEGIKISTFISNSYHTDEIGYDYTDSNGYYLMIFPKAHEKVNVEVDINSAGEDSALSRTQIFNIGLDEVNDYTIDFGAQPLYENEGSVLLHIDLPENSASILKIGLTGLVDNHRVDHNFSELPEDPNEWAHDQDYLVAPNQVITLQYLLQDGTLHEVQIPIGEEELTYTLQ